jgi:hypothetical protein
LNESIEYILELLCSCSRNRPNWYLNEILRSGALISITSPVHKPVEGKETRVATKKRPVIPKYSSISMIRDFPPILRRFNPHFSDDRKQAMHTHLTQISDEYARMELEEILMLKARALPERIQSSKDYVSLLHQQALVMDKEDPSKDSYEE